MGLAVSNGQQVRAIADERLRIALTFRYRSAMSSVGRNFRDHRGVSDAIRNRGNYRAAMLVAQVPTTPSFAQSVTPSHTAPQAVINNSAIVEAFGQYPQGGDALSKRIADLIVASPKRITFLDKYVRTAPKLSVAQKRAAEQGLAMALERLGVKAADMPSPPSLPAPVYDYTWLGLLLAAALIAGIICLVFATKVTTLRFSSPEVEARRLVEPRAVTIRLSNARLGVRGT